MFHYLGPSFAVLLFASVSVNGVAWLRIVSAALIFLIWRNPWKTFLKANKESRNLILGLGVIFAVMNYSFYYAIDSLPLGTVAAIEFIGPIILALVAMRTFRNVIALTLTTLGVYFLTDMRLEGTPIGFIWAFINAACFMLYIILAHRLSKSDPNTKSIDRLGASIVIAGICITPLGIGGAIAAFDQPILILAGIGVGISSSVIPYIFDQLAMARISRATYSLFVALFPATAVIIGIVVLGQVPFWIEVVAVILVIAGVIIVRDHKTE